MSRSDPNPVGRRPRTPGRPAGTPGPSKDTPSGASPDARTRSKGGAANLAPPSVALLWLEALSDVLAVQYRPRRSTAAADRPAPAAAAVDRAVTPEIEDQLELVQQQLAVLERDGCSLPLWWTPYAETVRTGRCRTHHEHHGPAEGAA